MIDLIHKLITHTAERVSHAEALSYQGQRVSYGSLSQQMEDLACAYLELGLGRSDRVAVFLEKRPETVTAMFAASAAGAVFVPINPLLKPDQVAYILNDCHVRLLVTSADRLRTLLPTLSSCTGLRHIILVDTNGKVLAETSAGSHAWESVMEKAPAANGKRLSAHQCIDTDMAAILYTSGSTGRPKGVVLSHRNLLAGAASVSEYLGNTENDRLLAVLPLSFDYGLSQLTTAFSVGASVVLMNYLFPQDVIRMIVDEKISGLAAVPPLWIQLSQQKWPAASELSALRYMTNSGGAMPGSTLSVLRKISPATQMYLMYGLTEAFRSSYLSPADVDARPDSIGKAIPGAELMVINKAGDLCAPNEPGELVHRGALVALGYWNDGEKTAERFRPVPRHLTGLPLPEIAVWSGDTVRMDEDGYLYFIGRDDDMIKVSGYRISPLEIEEVVDGFEHVSEQVAVGVPHPVMGQAIVLVVKPHGETSLTAATLRRDCQLRLPAYMVPSHIELVTENLPRNANGKIDRKLLQSRFIDLFDVKT
jgi:acyl-CoA ligase (AMP-forming) (exosortase A-associated)